MNREVINIFNAYGSVTKNTDNNGHGTHCAGNTLNYNFDIYLNYNKLS